MFAIYSTAYYNIYGLAFNDRLVTALFIFAQQNRYRLYIYIVISIFYVENESSVFMIKTTLLLGQMNSRLKIYVC